MAEHAEETASSDQQEREAAFDIHAVIRGELDGVADEFEAAGVDLDEDEVSLGSKAQA